jgi:hypothetical protein
MAANMLECFISSTPTTSKSISLPVLVQANKTGKLKRSLFATGTKSLWKQPTTCQWQKEEDTHIQTSCFAIDRNSPRRGKSVTICPALFVLYNNTNVLDADRRDNAPARPGWFPKLWAANSAPRIHLLPSLLNRDMPFAYKRWVNFAGLRVKRPWALTSNLLSS